MGENISGYGRVLARVRVEQQLNKSFLGKPYLKYGQCYILWPYFLQLGGILGAKHAAKLDAFGPAFLAGRGEPGAIEHYFTEVAMRLMTQSLRDSMTFWDYVCAEFSRRIRYAGDPESYFFTHAMKKMKPEPAVELAWQYARDGAALGAIYPEVLREMFERTYTAHSKEDWERWHAFGLDIPPTQERMSYEEVEEGEDEEFMAYCRECCPNIYHMLTAKAAHQLDKKL